MPRPACKIDRPRVRSEFPELQRPLAREYSAIILGDSGTGKTAFVRRWNEGFVNLNSPTMYPTVGVDVHNKWIRVDNTDVKLSVWDTAGQERYRSMWKSIYRRCQGAIIMFDVTNRESFSNVEYWLKELEKEAGDDLAVILVGNKVDEVPADIDEVRDVDRNVLNNNANSCRSVASAHESSCEGDIAHSVAPVENDSGDAHRAEGACAIACSENKHNEVFELEHKTETENQDERTDADCACDTEVNAFMMNLGDCSQEYEETAACDPFDKALSHSKHVENRGNQSYEPENMAKSSISTSLDSSEQQELMLQLDVQESCDDVAFRPTLPPDENRVYDAHEVHDGMLDIVGTHEGIDAACTFAPYGGYFDASAKSGQNVEAVFKKLAQLMFDAEDPEYVSRQAEMSFHVEEEQWAERQRPSCFGRCFC